MKDTKKTKAQLIQEMTDLRRQLADLESLTAEQKQTIEILQESEASYRRYFEHASIGMIKGSSESAFDKANQAFCEMLGYTHQELFYKNAKDITHPDHWQEDDQSMERILSGKQNSVQKRKRYIHQDGHIVWGLLSLSCVRDKTGKPLHFIAQVQDISELVKTEEALQQSNRRLKETLAELRTAQEQVIQQERMAAVGQLAAGIAHDFNNILASIILCTQLSQQTPNLPAQVQEWLETIFQQSERASNLVQQILDFGRRTMLKREIVDAAQLLQEMSFVLEHTLPDKIQVDLKFEQDEYKLDADPLRIEQVIMNLALNARDAMPNGGKLCISMDRLSIEKRSKPPLPEIQPGEWMRITVTDTGMGIPPEILPHIFEPFFTTRSPQGNGLGLAQVYGIIRQHNGYVKVDTQVGQGTTFALYLPALPASRLDVSIRETPTLPQGNGQKILVVENDPTVRATLAEVLEMLEYQVVEAANGHEALAFFGQNQDGIALVLSNWTTPLTGGLELAQKIQGYQPHTRILMLTDHPLDELISDSAPNGIVGWLQKPLSLEQLAKSVAQAVQLRETV